MSFPLVQDNPRHRKTDPDTSRLAAERMLKSGRLGKQQRDTLEAISYFSKKLPRTAGELAHNWCIKRYRERGEQLEFDDIYYIFQRRLNELDKAGFVERCASRKCLKKHTQCQTWQLRMD